MLLASSSVKFFIHHLIPTTTRVSAIGLKIVICYQTVKATNVMDSNSLYLLEVDE